MKLKYLQNSFLLMLPVLLWNFLLTNNLPAVYLGSSWNNIPSFIFIGENIFRTIILVILPIFMMFSLSTKKQRIGLGFYLVGIVVYFLSWIIVMLYPESLWSMSLVGYSAPAYTPILWLIGIGLMSDLFYFRIPYKSWVYILLSVAFIAFHFSHALLAYYNIY